MSFLAYFGIHFGVSNHFIKPRTPLIFALRPPRYILTMDRAIDYRSKCERFRTLIIGRANAGKTTLLKRVCNSIEDPEIFSPSGEKVIESVIFEHRQFAHLNQSQSIAARSRRRAGVIRGLIGYLTPIHLHLALLSAEFMISKTSSYSGATRNSFSTTLAASNRAPWTKLRRWNLSSPNVLKAGSCLSSCMLSGTMVMTQRTKRNLLDRW